MLYNGASYRDVTATSYFCGFNTKCVISHHFEMRTSCQQDTRKVCVTFYLCRVYSDASLICLNRARDFTVTWNRPFQIYGVYSEACCSISCFTLTFPTEGCCSNMQHVLLWCNALKRDSTKAFLSTRPHQPFRYVSQ